MKKLEADGIEFSYDGKKQVLSGIYINVQQGNITGLLGRNGSGKSTLMQIVYGILACKVQSVRIDGKRLHYFQKKNNIAYLPQYHFIPNELKISSILADFGNSRDEAEAFMDCKLVYNQRFYTLSDGEKRLLELFLVLHSSQTFILLDEPFSYLSPKIVERLIEKLHVLKNQKGILLTDHLYQHVLEVSDELYVMQNGYTQLVSDENQLKILGYIS